MSLQSLLGSCLNRTQHYSKRLANRIKILPAVAAAAEKLEGRQLLSSTWFVSTIGSDANIGTIYAPFQTIQRASSVAQPGDTVMIRGGIYHETVTPASSGTQAAPITYEPYNGESVTIDGADPVSGWSPNPVYQTGAMWWDLGEGNNQLFVNGKPQLEARWPNTSLDASHPTNANAQGASASGTTTTIYDSALTQTNGAWVGATIHFTPGQHWVAYTATVTASGPGYVTFAYTATSNDAAVSAGTSYYIVGKFLALDAPGEWYRDPTTGVLSLWPSTGDNAANDLVEAKHRLYGFNLAGVSNVTIQGINFFACTINTDANSTSITLNNINAQYVSQFLMQPDGWGQPYACGILLAGNNDLLENSQIAYSSGDGVFVTGTYDRVTNNVIHDVDTNGGDGSGVRNYGYYNSVDHNTIYNSGRNGINIFGMYVQVTYNTIFNCLIQTTDGGGIYTWSSNGTGSLIGYNRISNAMSGGYGGVGIYLDNNSSNWTVVRNVTSAVNYGFKANGTSLGEQVYNNTFDSTQYGLAAQGDFLNWAGSVVENNIFVQPFFGSELGVVFASNVYNGTNAALNSDYTLRPGSPAIDTGLWIAPYTNAYSGYAPDMGALEYGLTPFSSGAVIGSLPIAPTFSLTPPPAPASPPPPPPPTAPGGTLATSAINGLNYTNARGIAPSFGALGYLDGGDWVEYGQVNFQSGVSQFTIDLAVTAPYSGQQIQLRIDSLSGPVVGTLTTKATTAWNDFEAQSIPVADVTGIHNLYLIGVGGPGIANYSWFTFTPANTSSSSATYMASDTTTQGWWSGVYGADAYGVVGGGGFLPSYANLSITGANTYVWNGPGTSDPRAAQVSNGSATHVAGCLYSSGSFSFNLNLTDGQSHRISLYLLDYDYQGRSETVQITDAATNLVLASTDVNNFSKGDYLSYSISGNVKITIINDPGSLNAVASGIFFG